MAARHDLQVAHAARGVTILVELLARAFHDSELLGLVATLIERGVRLRHLG